MNDNPPNPEPLGLIPVVGELGADGMVTFYDTPQARAALERFRRPRPAPPRPALRLVQD